MTQFTSRQRHADRGRSRAGQRQQNPSTPGSSGGVLYIDVAADNVASVGVPTRQVRVATAILAPGTVNGNVLNFSLAPGSTCTLMTSVVSNLDSATWQSQAVANLGSQTQASGGRFCGQPRGLVEQFFRKFLRRNSGQNHREGVLRLALPDGLVLAVPGAAPGVWRAIG